MLATQKTKMQSSIEKLLEIIKQLLPFIAGWLSAQSREAKRDAKTMQRQRDIDKPASYADVWRWMRGKK